MHFQFQMLNIAVKKINISKIYDFQCFLAQGCGSGPKWALSWSPILVDFFFDILHISRYIAILFFVQIYPFNAFNMVQFQQKCHFQSIFSIFEHMTSFGPISQIPIPGFQRSFYMLFQTLLRCYSEIFSFMQICSRLTEKLS